MKLTRNPYNLCGAAGAFIAVALDLAGVSASIQLIPLFVGLAIVMVGYAKSRGR
jgi:hypothetical protein